MLRRENPLPYALAVMLCKLPWISGVFCLASKTNINADLLNSTRKITFRWCTNASVPECSEIPKVYYRQYGLVAIAT